MQSGVRTIQFDEKSIALALSSTATGEKEFGAFHYRTLVASWPAPRHGLVTSDKVAEFVQQNPDLEVQVDAALEFVAYLHEIRHLHDCFGTFAGLSWFGAHLHQMRQFLKVTQQLRSRKLFWHLPVTEWIQSASCPDFVKEFVHEHNQYCLLERLFMGGFVTHREAGFTNEVWRDGLFPQYRLVIPLYPLKTALIRQIQPEMVPIEGSGKTLWYAIGFEAVVEGIAQAIQRSYLENVWPPQVAKRVFERMRVGGEELARYNATDFLLTKYLEVNRGMSEFLRRLVLQVSDAALMESAFDLRVGSQRLHPGNAFTRVLQTSNWERPIEQCPRPHKFGSAGISKMVAELENTPQLREITADCRDPFAAVESWVHHKVALPLLRKRASEGDAVFYDIDRYIPIIGALPLPPLQSIGGKLKSQMDKLMLTHWAHYVMIYSLVEQILSGRDVLTCPRYSASFSGLNRMNLCEKGSGHCDEHRGWQSCGLWSSKGAGPKQQCLFSAVLQGLQVVEGSK